jgi:hypothetical protein
MVALLSWSQCFPDEGSNGELGWFELEPMHVAGELAIFPGPFLQRKHLGYLPIYLRRTIWEERDTTDWQIDIQTLTIIYIDPPMQV